MAKTIITSIEDNKEYHAVHLTSITCTVIEIPAGVKRLMVQFNASDTDGNVIYLVTEPDVLKIADILLNAFNVPTPATNKANPIQ